MGKGLSELQRRVLLEVRERERQTPESWRQGQTTVWLYMPNDVYAKAEAAATAALDIHRRSGHINGESIYKHSLAVTQWIAVEIQVSNILGDSKSVTDYLLNRFTEYVLLTGGALSALRSKMTCYAGVNVRHNRPAWMLLPREHVPCPSEEEIKAAIEAAPEGGTYTLGESYRTGVPVVSYNALLQALFGFVPSGHLDAQAFDIQQIGPERYNAARASLHRACARLEARGLVVRYSDGRGVTRDLRTFYERAGINLTPDGEAKADKLRRLLDESRS
jgi:hypothetical protein